MSANVPTDICFSFKGMMQRGGQTGPHRDGWGIGFYEGKGYRSFHDDNPSCESKIAQFVCEYPIKSHIVVSHIRQANSGRVCLENTHPFSRELWGQYWSFAHNGQLKGVKKIPLEFYQPVGTTDSEYAFCWMMDQIRAAFPTKPKTIKPVMGLITELSQTMNQYGVFNFILSDSKHVYAFCSKKLAWITRRAPFGEAQLTDADVTIDFAAETTPNDVVTVIATEPLTHNEAWNVMEKEEFIVFKDGEVVS